MKPSGPGLLFVGRFLITPSSQSLSLVCLSVASFCFQDGGSSFGFPGGSEGKASDYNARDLGLIFEWGRVP